MAEFTFDGANKLIIGAYSTSGGEFIVDVQIDLYSDWKEWMVLGDNSKYAIAFTTIGGEDIGGGLKVGGYYFLQNGWKIRPIEESHRLIFDGNLYSADGSSAFTPTLGNYNVLTELRNSSLTQAYGSTGGSSAADVWNYSIDGKAARNRLKTAEKKAKIAAANS